MLVIQNWDDTHPWRCVLVVKMRLKWSRRSELQKVVVRLSGLQFVNYKFRITINSDARNWNNSNQYLPLSGSETPLNSSVAMAAADDVLRGPGVGRTRNRGDLNGRPSDKPNTKCLLLLLLILSVTSVSRSRHGCGVTTYTFSRVSGEMASFRLCHRSASAIEFCDSGSMRSSSSNAWSDRTSGSGSTVVSSGDRWTLIGVSIVVVRYSDGMILDCWRSEIVLALPCWTMLSDYDYFVLIQIELISLS